MSEYIKTYLLGVILFGKNDLSVKIFFYGVAIATGIGVIIEAIVKVPNLLRAAF